MQDIAGLGFLLLPLRLVGTLIFFYKGSTDVEKRRLQC